MTGSGPQGRRVLSRALTHHPHLAPASGSPAAGNRHGAERRSRAGQGWHLHAWLPLPPSLPGSGATSSSRGCRKQPGSGMRLGVEGPTREVV